MVSKVVAVLAACVALSLSLACFGADGDMTRDQAKKLKNPVANTAKSVAHGKQLFLSNCTSCHGDDGKAEAAIIADATDLTQPSGYKSGTTEGEIFRSIRDGAGQQMPPFKYQGLSDDDIWNLVNFVHSLWPDAMKPPIQPEKK